MLKKYLSLAIRKVASAPRRRSTQAHPAPADVELLEDRALLAGNVLASMNARGDLVLRGDSQANSVSVTTFTGGIEVVGIGTRINGLPLPRVFFGASINNLNARLRGGSDRLVVVSDIAGDAVVRGGGGSDVVEFTSAIGGRLDVNVGAAIPGSDDVVAIANSSVAGTTRVRGTAGQQTFIVSASTFEGAATFSLGGGRDLLNVSASSFASGFEADGGGGVFDTFIYLGSEAEHRRFEMFT